MDSCWLQAQNQVKRHYLSLRCTKANDVPNIAALRYILGLWDADGLEVLAAIWTDNELQLSECQHLCAAT